MAEKYATYIESELSNAVSASHETSRRALVVVTTAGGLVTLISALIGFAAVNRTDSFFPDSARGALGLAIVCYVAAAAVALIAQLPLLITYADVASLDDLVQNSWDDGEPEAARHVAAAQVDMLRTHRKMNSVRSWMLIVAIAAEIGAIALTGVVANRVVHSLGKSPAVEAPAPEATTSTVP